MQTLFICILAACLPVPGMIQAAEPDMLYWSDMGDWAVDNKAVWRINLDGTGREQILSGTHDPSLSNIGNVVSILVDAARGHVYLGETFQNNKIRRVNLDGGNVETVCGNSLYRPVHIALDLEARRVYWCNGANDDVRYCDMSAGAVANDFVTDGNTVNAIALYLPPLAGTIFAFR